MLACPIVHDVLLSSELQDALQGKDIATEKEIEGNEAHELAWLCHRCTERRVKAYRPLRRPFQWVPVELMLLRLSHANHQRPAYARVRTMCDSFGIDGIEYMQSDNTVDAQLLWVSTCRAMQHISAMGAIMESTEFYATVQTRDGAGIFMERRFSRWMRAYASSGERAAGRFWRELVDAEHTETAPSPELRDWIMLAHILGRSDTDTRAFWHPHFLLMRRLFSGWDNATATLTALRRFVRTNVPYRVRTSEMALLRRLVPKPFEYVPDDMGVDVMEVSSAVAHSIYRAAAQLRETDPASCWQLLFCLCEDTRTPPVPPSRVSDDMGYLFTGKDDGRLDELIAHPTTTPLYGASKHSAVPCFSAVPLEPAAKRVKIS